MQNRFHISILTTAALMLGSLAQVAQAQDRIDLTKDSSLKVPYLTGTIRVEDPAKVTILQGLNRQSRDVPVSDIVLVKYDNEPGEVSQARAAERAARDLDKALSLYREGLKKIPNDQKFLRGDVSFRIARILAQQGEGSSAAGRRLAIEELRKFRREFPDSRQTVECLDLLSRLLLVEAQSPQEVVDAFKELKRKYGPTSKEISLKCDFFEGRLLVEDAQNLFLKSQIPEAKKKYAEAQTKLVAMLPNADKASALDIKISLAECKAALDKPAEALKDLDDIIKNANDNRATLAAAYLGRGDCQRLSNKPRDAMWDYLYVDVIYNDDREKQAKALYFLQDIFTKIGDTPRANECRDRLKTDRFKDTHFQRMVQ